MLFGATNTTHCGALVGILDAMLIVCFTIAAVNKSHALLETHFSFLLEGLI